MENPYKNIVLDSDAALKKLEDPTAKYANVETFVQMANNFTIRFWTKKDGMKQMPAVSNYRYFKEFESKHKELHDRICRKFQENPELGSTIEFVHDKELTEDLFTAYKIMYDLMTDEDIKEAGNSDFGLRGAKNWILTA